MQEIKSEVCAWHSDFCLLKLIGSCFWSVIVSPCPFCVDCSTPNLSHTMSISLLRSEVLHIGRNPEGLRFIWLALLDNAREPFYNLCDLISRGKSFCEPASTIQRKSAAGRLFASFAGILLNQEELPQNVAISFPDICAGLQTISERWSEYTSDELLSVALLLDLSGEGSVSYEDFLNFVNLANESLKQNPQKSRECFDTLYDCLTERIRGSLSGMNNFQKWSSFWQSSFPVKGLKAFC